MCWIAITVIAVHYTFAWGKVILRHLYRALGQRLAQTVICLGVGLAGLSAYVFKKVSQLLYGISEVIFAGASAIHVVGKLSPGAAMATQWATLIGCVYIISRGLGNISEGIDKPVDFVTTPRAHIK